MVVNQLEKGTDQAAGSRNECMKKIAGETKLDYIGNEEI